MDRGSNSRRIVVGLGSMVAGAALLVGALPGGAGAAPTQETTITSESVPGNPTCGELGDFDFEFKIDQEDPAKGEYADPNSDLVVTITAVDYSTNPATISLMTNLPVSAVFIKAGPGGILYEATPPTTVWNDLTSPKDSISHLSVCWDKKHETTTTTEKHDTTTTSEKHDTTTTSEKHETTTTTEKHETTTTTMADETTTTMADETTTTTVPMVTTTTPGDELPRTGNNTGPLVALGAMLLAGGTALVAGTKWRRAQQ